MVKRHIFVVAMVENGKCCLLPKQRGAHNVKQFRPIALCNVGYKLISKILTDRMKLVMNKLIGPYQAAFLQGRNIQDNVIIVQEVLHQMKSKRGRNGSMILKIDMEKAYDRIEWKFIIDMMLNLGFGEHFVKLVGECLASASFSVMLNGVPHGKFPASRGIRQGDPISPYLFIIATELLSKMLIRAEGDKIIKGVRIGKNQQRISHLLFADDIIIFGEATVAEARQLKGILAQYERFSGQKVNIAKSSVMFSKNTKSEIKCAVMNMLQFQQGSRHQKYLGFPLTSESRGTDKWNYVIDNISARICGWKKMIMSQATRFSLVKHIASTIPSYVMSVVEMPQKVCKAIDKKLRDFAWGTDASKEHSLYVKAWKDICQPTSAGGLGCRLMKDHNKALLSKLCWKIMSNDQALWAQMLRKKYIKNTHATGMTYIIKSSDSTIWKGIMHCQEVIHQGLCWQVGNGSQIRIWEVPWVPGLQEYKPSVNDSYDMLGGEEYVQDILLQNPLRWNTAKLAIMFTKESMEAIMKIPLSFRNTEDKMQWILSKKGIFTVKSGYHCVKKQYEGLAGSMEAKDWRKLWKLKVTARLKLLLWKAVNDILPTRVMIQKRLKLNDMSSSCVYCQQNEETAVHIFLQCPVAVQLWEKFAWPDVIGRCGHSIVKWTKLICDPREILSAQERQQLQLHALVYMDVLWFTRNKMIHEKCGFNIQDMEHLITKLVTDHTRAWDKDANMLLINKQVMTVNMDTDYKIFFDVAVRGQFSMAAAVCVQPGGNISTQWVRKLNSVDPLIGECCAADLAMELARVLSLPGAMFIGDSKEVINAINQSDHVSSWRIHSLIDSFVVGAQELKWWKAIYVPRASNILAHDLARKAASASTVECFPGFRRIKEDIWEFYDFLPP